MRRSRFSRVQMIGILKERKAGMPVAQLCRTHGVGTHGVSDAGIQKWLARFAGMADPRAERCGPMPFSTWGVDGSS